MNRIPADTDPQSSFYIGQVVLCHVLSCQPDKAKLILSFKVNCMSHHETLPFDNLFQYRVITVNSLLTDTSIRWMPS